MTAVPLPDTDVAVVGVGIVGISCAHVLAETGLRVVLVERAEIARGASFGNAGAFAFSDVLPLPRPVSCAVRRDGCSTRSVP